jgi:Rrf2 family protein
MQLNRSATYAVHALAFLACRKGNPTLTSHEMAEAAGLPEGFLPKVLKPLVWAGVLRSLKGPGGGFRLAWPPEEVSLLEVVEAVDGPIRKAVTFGDGRGGLDGRLQAVSDRMADVVRRALRKVSIADLAARGGNRRRKGE